MNENTIIEEFRNTFPELEEASRNIFDFGRGEGPHPMVFFGYVLNPFLIKELSTMRSKLLLKRIFEFLESMAISEENEVKWILTTTILEKLGDDKNILKKARSLMGIETLRMSHEVEKSWGRE